MAGMKDQAFGDCPAIYPEIPGHRGPEGGPSHRAALSMAADAKTMAARVLREIEAAGASGATADEIAAALKLRQPYATRPRLAELNRTGKIEDSGQRRPGTSGLQQTVWILRMQTGEAAA